ncbi:MAG: hypothetical protein IT580_10295 [Verrucomicrobiales bacterium]|nr:hypothetical protein [Verrucomicrobiales bacterium]
MKAEENLREERGPRSRSWRRGVVLGVLVGALGGAVLAHATRLVPLAPEQLCALADCVLLGRVEAVEVKRDAAGRIHTLTSLQILELWKGQSEKEPLAVVSAGGVLGETRIETVEIATPEVGERGVWFLTRNPAGEWVTVGLDQGWFRVRSGATEVGETVENRFHRAPNLNPNPHPGANPGVRSERRPSWAALTLAELRRRVRESIAP